MSIIFLPVEPLDERYSSQVKRWVEESMDDMGIDYITICPAGYKEIKSGQWLDTYGTTFYRLEQLRQVTNLFTSNKIKNGDIFLLGDVWFPGIENIKLMADLSDVEIKVTGYHHAGCFDPADLLAQKLNSWGKAWERSLLSGYLDVICTGSLFHKELLTEALPRIDSKIHPLGQPWHPEEVAKYYTSAKERIVVYPHRLAPEKGIDSFLHMAEVYPGWQFAMSTNNEHVAKKMQEHATRSNVFVQLNHSKEEYYRFLSKCSIFYSDATQETFGYSLHESIALGLHIIAPARCSYPEMLKHDPLYVFNPTEDPRGEKLLGEAMQELTPAPYGWTLQKSYQEKKFLRIITGL